MNLKVRVRLDRPPSRIWDLAPLPLVVTGINAWCDWSVAAGIVLLCAAVMLVALTEICRLLCEHTIYLNGHIEEQNARTNAIVDAVNASRASNDVIIDTMMNAGPNAN